MNSAGFSLIELIIVIAIVAIVSGLGLESMQTFKQRNQLSSNTQQLLRFLNEVKLDANLYNENHMLYLVKTNHSTWCLIVAKEVKPLVCEGRFTFKPDNDGIQISGITPASSIAFYGRRSMAQSATIKLINPIGESRVIVSVRGRIRYCVFNTYLAGFPKC